MLIIGLSLGYGSSQQFIVSEVKAQAIKIGHLEESDARFEHRFEEMDRLITTRIATLASLMEKNMEQTSELITIIRTERTMRP